MSLNFAAQASALAVLSQYPDHSDVDLQDLFRLRCQVFRGRLEWDVQTQNGLEKDDYDHCNPVHIIARQADGEIAGCCRLLPTTGPYMLRDTFPQLLGAHAAPRDAAIMEISRFAVTQAPRHGFGFTDVPRQLIKAIVAYALQNRINHFVFATTVGFERLIRRLGVHCYRLHEPMQVGIEKSVALWFSIDDVTLKALGHSAEALIAGQGWESCEVRLAGDAGVASALRN